MRASLSDLSLSAATAGFVAVLVGFTSSVAIVFQAATALGATPEQIGSWMWALGLGMGLCSLLPSLWLRKPVMVAWSTPGAAVLATAAATGGFTLAQAVGAFIVCAALITLFGITGWFEKLMDRIPMPIASALLAGVLARFGLDAFVALKAAFALNLAAITAAICMSREAHEDPAKRYMAAASCGLIYCVIGLFGAAVTGVLTAFPRELVVAVAGLALLGSIGGGLAIALKDDAHREAALITFLVTLSGLTLWGIGSAFWGVVAGAIALFVQQWRPMRSAA